MTNPPLEKLLIVVHPGSACGSADMNLGFDNASEQRGFLQQAIDQWEGPIVVFDGELSDELENGFRREWFELGRAIAEALDRATVAGQPAIRMLADDQSAFNQEAAAAHIASTLGLTADCQISLTGAWYHSSDGAGCVGSVKDVLEGLGLPVKLCDPMDLDAECDIEQDDEFQEEDVDDKPVMSSSSTLKGPR